MRILIIRTIIVYICLLLAMRLMGKRQLGQLQPSELVSTILISSLASLSIESPETPIVMSFIPLFLIVAIEISMSLLTYKSLRFSNFISGRANTIIRNGKIDQARLRRIGLNAGELLEALRSKDVFDLKEVSCAIIEANGNLSVSKKPKLQSATCQDVGKFPINKNSVVPFVIDGVIMEDNLAWCGKDMKWLEKQAKYHNSQINEILILLGDDTNFYYLIKKDTA